MRTGSGPKLITLFAAALCGGVINAQAASSPEPGGTPDDAALALTKPDEYAWKLFLFINRQAAQDKPGLPDPSKATVQQYDSDKDTIWESWALASGVNVVAESGKRGLSESCARTPGLGRPKARPGGGENTISRF
jgi:hypothetical protein